ncbi:helix-turn-helix domain-containing protein [Salmonella enterica]
MSLGERLKEERNRLGFNQSEFAALVGASYKSQLRWEKDESSPGADALSKWADIGLDVLYVVTGNALSRVPESKTTGDIDEILFGKIVHKLELLARSTNRRWTFDELMTVSIKMYNFLIKESAINDERIDSVLKLVVNN